MIVAIPVTLYLEGHAMDTEMDIDFRVSKDESIEVIRCFCEEFPIPSRNLGYQMHALAEKYFIENISFIQDIEEAREEEVWGFEMNR